MNAELRAAPSIDDHVAGEVVDCLLQVPPRSFFLYAGAGAGKTRTLVTVLADLQKKCGYQMRLKNQQIAVITYTNAACDEIVQRMKHDSLLNVRTINSFAWELIRGFNDDIRIWLKKKLAVDIEKLIEEQRKGRVGTKAAVERERSINAKRERLSLLDQIRLFTYSPDGANREKDSLSHAEVIGLTSDFLSEKPLMQRLLVCGHPILLVDESQDTSKQLVDALMHVENSWSDRFAMGLIGDTMQRIYTDGRADLAEIVPQNWATPRLQMNHRSPARVVRLINTIRSDADAERQKCRPDAAEGVVRLFVCAGEGREVETVEKKVRARMAEVAGDERWNNLAFVKTLLLEHQMAARRMNFSDLFEPLYRNERYKPGLLKGDLGLLTFFTDIVLPLITAGLRKNEIAVASILRKHSPLLSESAFKASGNNQRECLRAAKMAVEGLMELWSMDKEPTIAQVLELVAAKNLLLVPDSLIPFATPIWGDAGGDEDGPASADLAAIRASLQAPFSQLKAYHEYVNGKATFDTHHGVKGREFERVLVVINDAESKGFLYKYGGLFNTKATSPKKVDADKEPSEDRVRRLFYVTCSRSKGSLAVVVYTDNPTAAAEHAVSKGWFASEEIEVIH